MSPRGFAAVKEAADKVSRNGGFSGGPGPFYLRLDDGESAIIRFLEEGEEIYFFWFHDFAYQDKAQGWRTKFPCLDQEDDGTSCPGCEQQLHRGFQGLINIIWRDAPVLKKDDEGNYVRDKKTDEIVVDGHEDQIAIWRTGIENYKLLGKKDIAYKGLSSRDVEISRDGLKLDTTYAIEPADLDGGAKPLTKVDKELAKEKYDLEEVARFLTYEEAVELIENTIDESSNEDTEQFIKKNLFE